MHRKLDLLVHSILFGSFGVYVICQIAIKRDQPEGSLETLIKVKIRGRILTELLDLIFWINVFFSLSLANPSESASDSVGFRKNYNKTHLNVTLSHRHTNKVKSTSLIAAQILEKLQMLQSNYRAQLIRNRHAAPYLHNSTNNMIK